MALTNTYRNKIIDAITCRSSNNNSLLGFNEAYIGLSFTQPEADGSGVVEPTIGINGTGYTRTLIGKTGSNASTTWLFKAAEDGWTYNEKHIYFTEALTPWKNPQKPDSTNAEDHKLRYFVIFSSPTSADKSAVVAYAKLTHDGADAPIHVTNPNTVVLFRPEDLVIKYVDETVEGTVEET